jgi:transposase InsO family protein
MVRELMPVKLLCRVFEISRSGYYAWVKRPVSERKKRNDELMTEIKLIHKESRGTYGLPRIKAKLAAMGKCCGKMRISNLMKKAGISGLIKKRFKVKTTDSDHTNPIAPRVFKTEEPATHPDKKNQVWASDITYIPTDEGFVFLATYLDLFTRKLVGFATDEHMRTELILSALDMALGRQNLISASLIQHSDRGSQYASDVYRKKLEQLHLIASMSRKGNCYDNAFAESFFATLKKELIYRKHYKTKEQAKKEIFEYIEVWYNRNRIHSSIGYMTPVQFEESLAA